MAKKKSAKKKAAKRRMSVPRPRCSGQWTEARFRSFVVSALRSASMKWQPKWDAISRAYVGEGRNPKTGRKCKLHKCEACQELFAKGDMRADHIEPVVNPEKGFESWDSYIERMFVEQEGYQAVCTGCHDSKTKEERALRKKK